jgi:hypothetical protein
MAKGRFVELCVLLLLPLLLKALPFTGGKNAKATAAVAGTTAAAEILLRGTFRPGITASSANPPSTHPAHTSTAA